MDHIYLSEKDIANNKWYLLFKPQYKGENSVCPLCDAIVRDPIKCKICHTNFCSYCLENPDKCININGHQCQSPQYVKNDSYKQKFLNSLTFKCHYCKEEYNYTVADLHFRGCKNCPKDHMRTQLNFSGYYTRGMLNPHNSKKIHYETEEITVGENERRESKDKITKHFQNEVKEIKTKTEIFGKLMIDLMFHLNQIQTILRDRPDIKFHNADTCQKMVNNCEELLRFLEKTEKIAKIKLNFSFKDPNENKSEENSLTEMNMELNENDQPQEEEPNKNDELVEFINCLQGQKDQREREISNLKKIILDNEKKIGLLSEEITNLKDEKELAELNLKGSNERNKNFKIETAQNLRKASREIEKLFTNEKGYLEGLTSISIKDTYMKYEAIEKNIQGQIKFLSSFVQHKISWDHPNYEGLPHAYLGFKRNYDLSLLDVIKKKS